MENLSRASFKVADAVPSDVYEAACRRVAEETDQKIVTAKLGARRGNASEIRHCATAAFQLLGKQPGIPIKGFEANPLLDDHGQARFSKDFVQHLSPPEPEMQIAPVEELSYVNKVSVATVLGTAVIVAALMTGTFPLASLIATKTLAGFKLTTVLSGVVGLGGLIAIAMQCANVQTLNQAQVMNQAQVQQPAARPQLSFDEKRAYAQLSEAIAVRITIDRITAKNSSFGEASRRSFAGNPIIKMEPQDSRTYDTTASMAARDYRVAFDHVDEVYGFLDMYARGQELLKKA